MVDIYFFSQGFEDLDKKIRDLIQCVYRVRKSTISWWHCIYYDYDTHYLGGPESLLGPRPLRGKKKRFKYWRTWQIIKLYEKFPNLLKKYIPLAFSYDPKFVLWVRAQQVNKDTYFNKDDHTAVDGYELVERTLINRIFSPQSFEKYFAPKYWKMFDSFSKPELEKVESILWTDESEIAMLKQKLEKAILADEAKLPKGLKSKKDDKTQSKSKLVDTTKDNTIKLDKNETLDYVLKDGLKYPVNYFDKGGDSSVNV